MVFMPDVLACNAFLSAPGILLDSRSPGEFEAGHIPGAISFPLFSNEERSRIGTCYKQVSQEAAIELGLELVGPKLVQFVQTAKQLAPNRQVRLHCWRGGMRSNSMAWLLETAGFQVTLLGGGYKAFRRWVRSTLSTPQSILILGGMTGTGKTKLLSMLHDQGEQVLDLEALANHRGSSYGALGLGAQPTTEQFENDIAMQWAPLNPNRPVWIEAESRRVGVCRVPDEIFVPMMRSPVIQIVRSRQERIDFLIEVYGSVEPEGLIAATDRIARKLGGQHAKSAIDWIREGNLAPAIDLILNYYDKTYLYDLQRRNVAIHSIDVTGFSDDAISDQLIQASKQLKEKLYATVDHG